MISDEERKAVAEKLLKNGWIEATPENIKAYMDGFEMARNKSHKETGISAEEYIKRFAENEHPINIRQLFELSIEAGITEEETLSCGAFLETLIPQKNKTKEEK